MMSNKNFDYLGNNFQLQLINQIIVDKVFLRSIIDVIDTSYFENKYFKLIVQMVKEYYHKYETSPTFETLNQIVRSEITQETVIKVLTDTLQQISEVTLDGVDFVQEKALKFCKQQELKKVIKKAEKIIDSGEFENYDTVESMVRGALQVGELEENTEDVFSDLDEILVDDFRSAIPIGIPGIDKLLKGGLAKGEIGVILAPTGVGKSLGISEPVLTPSGWVRNGDISVGDKVIGSDGKEQYVLGVYPQGIRPIYRIEFTDGTESYCDKEHLWSVNTLSMRSEKTKYKSINPSNYEYKVVTTGDMMKDIRKKGRYNYMLPIVEPINFGYRDVPIDPYLLGRIIGDGNVTINDQEIFEDIENLNEYSNTEYYSFGENGKDIITNTIVNVRLKSEIKDIIEKLDLLDKKINYRIIPDEYLYNSLAVRIALLQGLMDMDGHIDNNGIIEYTTLSKELCNNVRELVLSLGGTAKINTKILTDISDSKENEGQLVYMVMISFANNIIPFREHSKVDRYRKSEKYVEYKYVKSITYSHDEEAVCIKVSNPDELYVTRDYVLTHNTTILTKFANHAFNLGYNVLQIFFEDNPKIIKRKHLTLWTGISSDDLFDNKDEVMAKVNEIKDNMSNRLILKKLASDSISMTNIKNQVRKLISDGIKIDLVVLDYIDCLVPDRRTEDEWKSEGSIMRGFEAMCHELNLVGWTATQGNRSAISSDIVTNDQMGGSIKKAQVGHVIISVAKSLQQKEMKMATIAITKSRIGSDGVIFENCKFDNEKLIIDTESSVTFLGYEEQKEERKRNRVTEILERRKER